MDVPTFDGRLDYSGRLSDPQFFLNWLHSMFRYLTRYLLSEMEKVRFFITKLTGQASQYWVDVERNRKARLKLGTIWRTNSSLYVPPYFYPS